MNVINAFNGSKISQLNDPFQRDYIRSIHIHVNKGVFSGKVICSAIVEFENENTKGTHRIQAEDFQGVVDKLNSFIGTL